MVCIVGSGWMAPCQPTPIEQPLSVLKLRHETLTRDNCSGQRLMSERLYTSQSVVPWKGSPVRINTVFSFYTPKWLSDDARPTSDLTGIYHRRTWIKTSGTSETGSQSWRRTRIPVRDVVAKCQLFGRVKRIKRQVSQLFCTVVKWPDTGYALQHCVQRERCHASLCAPCGLRGAMRSWFDLWWFLRCIYWVTLLFR